MIAACRWSRARLPLRTLVWDDDGVNLAYRNPEAAYLIASATTVSSRVHIRASTGL